MKRINNKKRNGGYIALMATIVISLILLVMIVEEGSAGWYARFNILGTEAKEQANALAEGCAEQAMATLLTDPTYAGDITTTNSVGTCHVFPVQLNFPVAGLVTIKTQAVVRESYANLDMALSMNDIHLGTIPTAPTTGTLFITTHVINDSTGSKQATDFTMVVSANPNSTFSGSESGVAKIIQPGAYSVSESAVLPNYSKTATSGCSGNIIAGEIKFCTITYDDVTTTLTVIVNVVNNDLGTNIPANFPLFIDGTPVTLGQRVTVTAGTHTVSATTLSGYGVSPWGYDCAASGSITMVLGQNKTCIINFDDLPAPGPSCADTVMILDRTGSMSNTDLTNERNAANSLVSLYAGVLPPATPPQIGVGSIGGLYGNTDAQVPDNTHPIVGWLTTVYSRITNAVTTMTSSNSSVGSNLSAGIDVAATELNSARHISGKQKVIVLVSDGDPNEPSGTTSFNTGYKSPTLNAQNGNSDLWNNTPDLSYADGSGDASDLVSENDRHQFYNFGIGNGSGLPTGSTVNGIEISADVWATAGTTNTPGNSNRSPSSTMSSPNQWTNTSRAYSSDDSYTTNSTSGNAQGYSNFGFAIPSNATITGVQVTTEAKISGGTPITSGTLFPNGQGFYTNWTNGESTVDETGTPDCSGSDSITTNNTNARESVVLDLSSIPNGAVITDVTVSTYDRGDFSSGGTYKTFVRAGNVDTDAGVNLSATGTSGCNLKTQSINIPDTSKNAGTILEVGVIKVTGNNNTVRVGAIRATVTYTTAVSGVLDINLSSNNGTSWTTSNLRTVAINGTESAVNPTGNTVSDLWNRSWSPSDFNNGNFVLRVINNSASGPIVSLDQVSVNVFYTVPTSTGTSCQLGVDLSWNGGLNWTTEKLQNNTGTETSYILGSPSDRWTSSPSHTWVATDFSNTNFRARVRAIDPGANCDNTAIEHLDWLQAKVYYSQNVDPVQAALNSADTAKLSGIDIFTIHFGSDPGPYNGKKLLANLATGNTAVSGHQNGSVSDGTSGASDTGLVAPTISTAPNQWTNPTRAFVSDNSYATNNTSGHQQGFTTFGFNIPPTATISGVSVEIEAKSSDSSGCQVGAEVSSNNGTSYTSTGYTSGVSGNDNTYTLGGSANLWGRSWSNTDFSNGKFVVRLQNIDPGNSCTNGSTLSVDRVRARVYYTINQENGDGDNFFVAPTSADMQGIFNFIGQQVCPASLNLTPTAPPTTGTVVVITQVTNNNGGSKVESDFTANITAVNPSANTATGNSAGVNIIVDPGAYNVTENGVAGYTETLGASCSSAGSGGNIVAGETRICVINNDDIPPPPPPPNLNFDPGTWKEVPTAS